MNIIIIGAGEVGTDLSMRLSRQEHDIVLIDQDAARLEAIREKLDVRTVHGNGAAHHVLEKAAPKKADLLLAVTDKDEVNLMACICGKECGVKQRIARLRDPDYCHPTALAHYRKLGVDQVINPDEVAAEEMLQLLRHTMASDVAVFAGGKVELIGIKVNAKDRLINTMLSDFRNFGLKDHLLIAAVARQGKVIIPRGDTVIQENDIVYILGDTETASGLDILLNRPDRPLRNVMIAGAGRTSYYLARLLHGMDVGVKVIEGDQAKCEWFAEALPEVLVLKGDAGDTDLMNEEGLEEVDGFVAATPDDEVNVLYALLAKRTGVPKAISVTHKSSYLPIISTLGPDAAVSPIVAVANAILKVIHHGRVISVNTILEGEAEILELRVSAGSKIINRKLSEVNFPKDALLAAVARGKKVIIPRGDTVIKAGDLAIVFMLPAAVKKVEKLFA
jgi:trk system potassium uptake protein TrkA